ncbi:unnamed protein product [Pylaiella littoralis]
MAGCRPGRGGGGGGGGVTLSWLAVLVCAAAVAQLALGLEEQLEFVPRNFTGEGNNIEFPLWGSAGTAQIRAVAGAEYAEDGFTAPGEDRPTAREVMTDVFLTSTAGLSSKSALFVAWGQLVTFDLALTQDNGTDPLPVPCNFADDEEGTDVWCPLGDASEEIPFFRSDAAVGADGARSPINYATSYLDLDFVYGRTAEEAEVLRTLEGGFMNITARGTPYQNADGTWLIADQRTARYPATFALHIVLLLEHNRCCVEVAPGANYVDDEGIYQACRGWTIATFQHITQNDFLIRLLGVTIEDLGLTMYLGSDYEGYATSSEEVGESHRLRQRSRRYVSRTAAGTPYRVRRLFANYNVSVNAAADVFIVTAGGAALESALPGTVRIVADGFVSVDDDNIGLNAASADLAGLFARNDVANIIRGAVLSPALDLDPYFSPVVSNLSPVFKLPVDAVQRGRDHGLPTYNDAREAYGLGSVANFSALTPDADLAGRISAAYGGDIDSLDAVMGALAEGTHASTGGVLGDLLLEAWSDQLFRSIAGDRFYHSHARAMEGVANTTLMDLVSRVTNASDMPLSLFMAPTITVCNGQCTDADGVATLSDSFEVSWEEVENDQLAITLRSKGLGNSGWMGIGWGGLTMAVADDFVICEVLDDNEGECTDRAYTTAREVPPLDDEGEINLNVTAVSVGETWTSITFLRDKGTGDGEDYDLAADIDAGRDTYVIFAYREGEGIGQHPNANRGAATVNFATGNVEVSCDDNDFLLVHGSLMLVAWMVLAPMGIYYVRYRKGESITWFSFDFEWFEMHQELMIIASEAVLPLAITAVFASGGDHTTSHAHWGYFMIAAVALQVFTGFVRVKGLEAAQANFSFVHRFNKHFHIWAGRFAYLAGVVQCYRGLELVSGDDTLILSAGDGLDLELANFDTIQDIAFPLWFLCVAVLFVILEARKQYRRYVKKGAASICGFFEVVNTKYDPDAVVADEVVPEDRLMPRTEALPLYTVAEFNEKVLHGQSWVLVDGAVLDVSEFSHRHPGGARLILNALGTDVTHELLGEDLSVGHAMSFSPHRHPESAWEIARSLVVGYIEEEEDEREKEEVKPAKNAEEATGEWAERSRRLSSRDKNRAFRIAGKAVLMQARLSRGGSTFELASWRLQGVAPSEHLASTYPFRKEKQPLSRRQVMAVDVLEVAIQRQGGWNWSSKHVLERYHVCPLLFREKMTPETPVGGGQPTTKRPVYRYVFSCPGQAQALVEAINGVCHFNVRAQATGKGVIQRSYNAYAVRVQDSDVTGEGGDKKRGGTPKVIPARETTNGTLCIEMRIRIYHDGAMSQILEKLSKDTDNPSVQLQGPYIISKLVPPPAHRNVVMIAAGTGINPMVQQIRDYVALPSQQNDGSAPSKSRLVLVWQSTSEAELYGTDEITELQVKSQGLLEVTVLVSGDQRRRNVPGAAFKKKVIAKARALVSPVFSPSSSDSDNGGSSGFFEYVREGSSLRAPTQASDITSAHGGGSSRRERRLDEGKSMFETWKDVQSSKFGPHPKHLGRTKELKTPARKPRSWVHPERSPGSDTGVGGPIGGTVTRKVLDRAFGPRLLNDIEYPDDSRLSSASAASQGEEKRGHEVDISSSGTSRSVGPLAGAQRFHLPCREHPGRDECPIGCNRSPRLNEGDKQPNRQFVSFFVATFRLQMYGYLCIYEVNV